MKKLVLFFAVLVAVSFVSCGNKKAEAPAEEVVAVDSTAVTADTAAVAADTAAVATEAAPVAK
jgi:hypothetical protein